MFRTPFLALVAIYAPLQAAELITPEVIAQSGRRMIALDVNHNNNKLMGRAPQGEGAPFRIMTGNEVLWEGGAGEAFSVPIYANRVYLMSLNANNVKWTDLSWGGGHLVFGKSKGHINITKYGIKPGLHDSGPAFRKMLSSARIRYSYDGGTVKLPKGEYHFYPDGAHKMSYYVSNHDQQDVHAVGLPLVDMANLTIDGQGSTFIFHGMMQPILIMDSQNVTLKNIAIDYVNPFSAEGRIVEQNEGKTTLEFDKKFSWKLQGREFFNTGENWQNRINSAIAFKPDSRIAPGTSDIGWGCGGDLVKENQVRFDRETPSMGLEVGDTLTLRSYYRPHPAMVIYRASKTNLENVIFRDSQGMALLAQRSEDITIRGGGCIRGEGRKHTAGADATHFSNCRGLIDVQGALYEGMMDDAINVHSTCLAIREVISPTEIICEYVHGQAIGFEVLLSGEKIQWIHGKTLENHTTLSRAKSVERSNERTLRITLESPLPEGIGVGDAFESADWYPEVIFKGNTIRHNRARGSLFTTPKRVLVEGNKFIHGSGSAILLAGDAQGWYESGRCLNVIIRDNDFEHNLTSRFQFTEGIISIFPEVKDVGAQQERYHQNILIENNRFMTHRVPLVFAISTKGLIFRNNSVKWDEQYPGMHDGKPFIFRHCEEMEVPESP